MLISSRNTDGIGVSNIWLDRECVEWALGNMLKTPFWPIKTENQLDISHSAKPNDTTIQTKLNGNTGSDWIA